VKVPRNDFLLRRHFEDHVVEIRAERIPRLELWGLTCRVDGELFDQSESDDDVWAAIRAILEEAVVEAQDRDDEANEEA
jgi:hypothetical protein